MSRLTQAISDSLLISAESALQSVGKSSDIGRKLQAIISAKTHGIKAVAKIFGVSRQTIMNWIKSFESSLEEGLAIKSGRGRKRLISKEIEEEIRVILQEYPNKTLLQIQEIILKNHNIEASLATIHRILKRIGLSYITPRPKHYKTDAELQEEFKKNS